MYEANPLAFITEQAGGYATDGNTPILKKQPTALHERTPLIIGSRKNVDQLLRFLKGEAAPLRDEEADTQGLTVKA